MLIKRSSDPSIKRQAQLPVLLGILVLIVLLGLWTVFPNEEKPQSYLSSKGISSSPFLPRKSAIPIDTSTFQTLDIHIDTKGLKKLQKKKMEAIEKGILETGDNDWVDGLLIQKENHIPIQLRLKGDWMDHVKGKKPSYRIKVKGENTWNRLKTFSIQRPETRDFLSEWVFHQLLRQEGLLTTRYDFIKVKWNGNPLGVYAYEEHFEKQLPEFNHRREGPIVKFSEASVWKARQKDLENQYVVGSTEGSLDAFMATQPAGFQENRMLKDSLLSRQYTKALQLMESYRSGNMPVSEIFDIPHAAKYYALLDIGKAFHNLVWHNQRFYFNPVVQKLEPIGFDAYTIDGPMDWLQKPFVGHAAGIETGYHQKNLIFRLFLDEEMMVPYIRSLHQFSDTSYISNFLSRIEPALKKREDFIKKDYPQYAYNRKWLIAQAKKIRSLLYPMGSTAIHIRNKQNFSKQAYGVSNRHILPIQIIGTNEGSSNIIDSIEYPPFLPPYYKNQPPKYQEITLPAKAKMVFFKLPGLDSLFQAPIPEKGLPDVQSESKQLVPMTREDMEKHPAITLEGKTIRFLPKEHTLSELLVIPAGYHLIFEEGTHIDLVNSAAILSYSPLQMLGQPENPIRIYSSDNSGQGLVVLQAKSPSRLRPCVI